MSLPFYKEPLAKLQQRYRAAVTPVYDYRTTVPRVAPSSLRGHTFDFEDGLRMIVSRDLTPHGLFLHVSASVHQPSEMWDRTVAVVKQVPVNTEEAYSNVLAAKAFFKAEVERRWRELSGEDMVLDFCMWSPGKGVPHWMHKLSDAEG